MEEGGRAQFISSSSKTPVQLSIIPESFVNMAHPDVFIGCFFGIFLRDNLPQQDVEI